MSGDTEYLVFRVMLSSRQSAEAFGFSLPPVPIFHEAVDASQNGITYLTRFIFACAR